MLKISYAGCLGLPPAVSMQFTRSKLSQAEIAKNPPKPLFEIQGHARSSMLINLKSTSAVLVMICSMSVPICNRFHSRRANTGKITSF